MAEEYPPSQEGFLDDIDSVTKFEEALTKSRDHIAKYLNVMSMLINRCSFKDVISDVEQGKIRACYDRNSPQTAANMFIDAILDSKDRTKLSVFKDALKRSEGNELINDILSKGVTKSLKNHEAHHRLVDLQRGYIAEHSGWETQHVYEVFLQEQLLTSQEYQEVKAEVRNHGDIAANSLILSIVPRRKHFFRRMLKALWDLDYRNCVKRLDKYFFEKMEADGEFTSDLSKLDTPDDDDEDNATQGVGTHCDDGDDDDDDQMDADASGFDDDDNGIESDAIGFNYIEHHSRSSGEWNMALNICTEFSNNEKMNDVKMMNYSTTNNLNLPDDDGPIASRTRCKTKLLTMKGPEESVLNEPVVEQRQTLTQQRQPSHLTTAKQLPLLPGRDASTAAKLLPATNPDENIPKAPVVERTQPGASYRPRETVSADQAVVGLPRSDAVDSSKKSLLGKDAARGVTVPEGKQTKQRVILVVCLCGKRFLSEDVMRKHQRTDCSGKTDDLAKGADLQKGKQTTHKVKLASCEYCDKRFLSEDVMRKHQRTDCLDKIDDLAIDAGFHKGKQTTHKVKLALCEYCDKRFLSEDAMRKHQRTDCLGKIDDLAIGAGFHKGKQTTHKVKLALCEYCDKRFLSEDAMTKHQRTDCSGKTDDLAKGAANGAGLPKGKQTTHKANLASCEYCDKRFISEETLKTHQITVCQPNLGHHKDKQTGTRHKETKPIIVQEDTKKTKHTSKLQDGACGKRFVSEESLRKHEEADCKLHRGPDILTENYREHLKRCICGKTFISSIHLNNHRKNCPKVSPISNSEDEDQPFDVTNKPRIDPKLVELEPRVASSQDREECQCICGESFNTHELRANHMSRQQCARRLPHRERNASLPHNAQDSPRREETNQRTERESLHYSAHSNGSLPNSVPQGTVGSNDRPNSRISSRDVKETRQSNGDTNSRRGRQSAGGFGFQSPRTLQLNRDAQGQDK